MLGPGDLEVVLCICVIFSQLSDAVVKIFLSPLVSSTVHDIFQCSVVDDESGGQQLLGITPPSQ